jgi:site-specific recombinase XerD
VILEAAGLPTIRENGIHALRHHYASVLLEGGVSIKALAEHLVATDGRSRCASAVVTHTELVSDMRKEQAHSC